MNFVYVLLVSFATDLFLVFFTWFNFTYQKRFDPALFSWYEKNIVFIYGAVFILPAIILGRTRGILTGIATFILSILILLALFTILFSFALGKI